MECKVKQINIIAYIFIYFFINLLFRKEFNKNMRCRYIIWIVSVIIVHIFCWWMVLAFCAVYVNTNNGWLFGAIISIIIDFLAFQISLSFIYAVLRHFAKKENSSL